MPTLSIDREIEDRISHSENANHECDLVQTLEPPSQARSGARRKPARKFRLDWYEGAMLLLTVSSAAACVLCLGRLGF